MSATRQQKQQGQPTGGNGFEVAATRVQPPGACSPFPPVPLHDDVQFFCQRLLTTVLRLAAVGSAVASRLLGTGFGCAPVETDPGYVRAMR